MSPTSFFLSCCKRPIILLHFSLMFGMIFPLVLSDYRWSICNNGSTFTDGSIYSSNLDQILSNLLKNAPQNSGFNSSSFGQAPNKVYGLLQCFGNESAEKCSDCAQQANSVLKELCANDIDGMVLMDDCFLRYGNSNFISTLDTDTYVYMWNLQSISQTNLVAAKGMIFGLLSDLIESAAANKGFASGQSTYSTIVGHDKVSGNVYGIVQCWGDISMNDCSKCLSTAINEVEHCCYHKRGARALLGSCIARYEIYPFFGSDASVPTDAPSTSIAPPPPDIFGQTDVPITRKSSRKLAVILGIVGGIIVTLAGCSFAMRRKVKSAVFKQPATLATQDEDPPETRLFKKEQILFSLETLIEATEDFSDSNKLGEGGFGAVYKGMTKEGKEIAVKKLSARSAQGKREFMNEVELVSSIQHRNLVSLLGCCAEGSERLLVYEYLQNKSLDAFLFGNTDLHNRTRIDWQKRFNIIIGIARGLLYLHEDSKLRIIHRDIKASNILLDEQLNPKIADFGLARLFTDNDTQIQSKVAGTYGYMAPEYAMTGQLSVKVDVYSFGVLLLEIVSGRKNTDINLSKENRSFSLVEWAWRAFKGGIALKIVDSVMVGNCVEEQVLRCIQIGLLCTQADPDVRPIISNVVTMLSTDSAPLSNPTKPGFVSMTSHSPNISLVPGTSSRNETSMSTMEPR